MMIINSFGTNMGRILILNRRYCPGEAWTNRVLAYAKGWAELGEEVVLYYLITDNARTPYEINIPLVKIIDLWKCDGLLGRKLRIWSFIRNLYLFKKDVREGDNVFMYGGYEYQLKVAMDIRNKARVFSEVTEHPDINGNSRSKFNLVDINDSMKKLNGLFVISNSLKEYYESLGISADCIHVSNMFVDINRFKDLKKATNRKYIAYCGAVSYGKDGVNILIEAFAKFAPIHKDYQLYIIGKSVDTSELERLKELAEMLGVASSVVFTGAIPPEQMPQILYDASILALARPDSLQAQNGFPTKLGEYLATGNPVVVTKVGEIPLFIKHGVNGFLSDPNADSFAEQLTWVADNYEHAFKVGQKGKELADNEFSYLSQSEKVLRVINQ